MVAHIDIVYIGEYPLPSVTQRLRRLIPVLQLPVSKLYFLLFHFSAVPLEPANVEIFGIDSDELSVRWSPSEDADSFEVRKYVVQHREFSDKVYTSASQPASDDKTQYTFRIQPLEPETTYMVRVGAVNKYGENYNDESTHRTEPTRKPFLFRFYLFLFIYVNGLGV